VADSGNHAIRSITILNASTATQTKSASRTRSIEPSLSKSFSQKRNTDTTTPSFSLTVSTTQDITIGPFLSSCPGDEMCSSHGVVVRGLMMNGTQQSNCSCDCSLGYDRATNCSSKLPCPESSMCNGNGNITGNMLDGCGCVCLSGFDNRTNCSTLLPCPSKNTTCHGKGNVSGNLLIGCSCECEPGYNASTNCSTPLQCPWSMCNGHGTPIGDIARDKRNCTRASLRVPADLEWV
jgi:hypothetical protein